MSKHHLLCLLGESGSGKSTVANRLVEWGYKSIPSYTTRKQRDGEVNGKDHIFVHEHEFKKMQKEDKIVCSTYFDGNYYGADKNMVLNNHIYVVDCQGVRELKANLPSVCVIPIYIYVPQSKRIEFMKQRGDDDNAIYKRIRNDSLMFEGIEDICDYKIYNNNVNQTASIVDAIYKSYKEVI